MSRTIRIHLEHMDCPTEEKLVRGALEPMGGIETLRFNLLERELTVTHTMASDAEVLKALDPLQLGARLLGKEAADGPQDPPKRHWALHFGPLALSGVLAFAAEIVALVLRDEHASVVLGLAVGSLLSGGLPTLSKGWVAIRSRTININVLMTVAIAGAMGIREWPEAAIVTFLFGLAEAIESASLGRARDAVRGLLAITPPTAFVRRGEAWTEVPITNVKIGDVVRLRPGERIPVDGRVRAGEGSVNQAPITGESMPVHKSVGGSVFSGTLNAEGLLQIEVTALASDTTLARIVRSIQDAQADRAPTQRFVDTFARYYTPIVGVLSIGLGVVPALVFDTPWPTSLYRGLVLLVVACPCALVISTPVTVVSALAAAARRGILVKGGTFLEGAKDLAVVALDKTGTLTQGRPAVTDVLPLGGVTTEMALRTAAALEAGSDHPIAIAVLAAWRAVSAEGLEEVTQFRAIAGRGVEGRIGGALHILGSPTLAEARGVSTPEVKEAVEALELEGKTTMVLADADGPRAVIAVADQPRASTAEALRALHALGVRSVMLTGDNARTARAIADSVGIDETRAQLMPQDKVTAIEELLAQHGPVGMVGDGINDGPALARSSIGFAMGAAGTDTAIETADVAFMDDDLRKLPELIELSRTTGRVLRQNIAFAIGIKLVFFGLTLAGVATLWMAVFADMGASLLVVANGLRLLRWRRDQISAPHVGGGASY